MPSAIPERPVANSAAAGSRDADDWLARYTAAWQPKIPVAELTAICLENASRRREALAPVLRVAALDAYLAALTFGVRGSLIQL